MRITSNYIYIYIYNTYYTYIRYEYPLSLPAARAPVGARCPTLGGPSGMFVVAAALLKRARLGKGQMGSALMGSLQFYVY